LLDDWPWWRRAICCAPRSDEAWVRAPVSARVMDRKGWAVKHRIVSMSAAILASAGLAGPGAVGCRASAATPPTPTYGTAVVNGNPGEWDLTSDFYAPMYVAGDPTKAILANGYLRYDCATNTLYVLVLQQNYLQLNAIPLLTSPTGNAWTEIDGNSMKEYTDTSGNDGTPPDFAWVGLGYSQADMSYAQGYEASFSLMPGSYTIVVHVEALNSTTAATAAFVGFNTHTTSQTVPLDIDCSGDTPTPGGTGTVTATPEGTRTMSPSPSATATPSRTATGTATATATRTTRPLAPDGESCTNGSECVSMNCVDHVCCATACSEPDHACNVPGRAGTCGSTNPAAAPALSEGGLAGGIAILVLVSAVGLYRRRE
jgi:hypothetical protein